MVLDRLDIVYIVCITVVILFGVAFIAISALYFNSKKKLYVNLVEDPKVRIDVKKDLKSLRKKYGEPENIVKGLEKRQKREKKASNVLSGVLVGVYVLLLGLVGFSMGVQQTGGQLFVGENALLVIKTESMSEVYSGNESYLRDNGVLGSENRIDQYDLIALKKIESEESITPFKVYAFKMESKEEGKTVTIVHRLIDVNVVEGDNRYTFRGDANNSSMVGEINVPFEDIVGEWTGYRNLALGMFIVYLQSGIGIVTLLTAFLLLIIYSFLYTKSAEQYEVRYRALLRDELGIKETASACEDKKETPSKQTCGVVTLPLLNGERPVADASPKNEKEGTLTPIPAISAYKNLEEDPKPARIRKKAAPCYYLEQGERKYPLHLLENGGDERTYAFKGLLRAGLFLLADRNGKSPFGKGGFDCFICFGKDDSSFKVSFPKASLLSNDGKTYYFIGKKTTFEALKEGDVFLSFVLRKADKKPLSYNEKAPLSILAVKRSKKEGAQ